MIIREVQSRKESNRTGSFLPAGRRLRPPQSQRGVPGSGFRGLLLWHRGEGVLEPSGSGLPWNSKDYIYGGSFFWSELLIWTMTILIVIAIVIVIVIQTLILWILEMTCHMGRRRTLRGWRRAAGPGRGSAQPSVVSMYVCMCLYIYIYIYIDR